MQENGLFSGTDARSGPFWRMPRYLFHIFENGNSTIDPVGIDVPDDKQLQLEAMRVLPEIARDAVPHDGDRQAFTVLVLDASGKPVYTATLTFAGLWLRLDQESEARNLF